MTNNMTFTVSARTSSWRLGCLSGLSCLILTEIRSSVVSEIGLIELLRQLMLAMLRFGEVMVEIRRKVCCVNRTGQ